MALVKAKDIPYETEALRKRIEFVKKLQKVLEDESMLVTKTVEAYSEVIDEIVRDVCLSVHREVSTGMDGLEDLDLEEKTQNKTSNQQDREMTAAEALKKMELQFGTAKMLGVQMSGSKGAVDMFGNSIQPVALEQVGCPVCGRKIAAGRFAPHLEKCIGGGRQASRVNAGRNKT
eukprot:jgi/Picsp_1/5319/NSC_02680-R1_ataxin-7-like protein 3